ncbi:MAG: putative Ig domain-containing protein, partial [Pseudomonadales bacterium]
MQNTFSFSIHLTVSILMFTVLSACGGGGSSDNDPPPPPANAPPVLNAIGAQTVEEAQTLNFSASATDAESTPELSVSGLPSGATFDAASGTFNWVPTVGDSADSPYEVTFTATDSAGLTDTEIVNITVTVPPNQTPVLTSIGNQGVQETQALSFTVTATDAESTPVLSATGLPTGASFDPVSGEFAWTPIAGDAANSPYSVIFTATDDDDNSLTATETVIVTVAPEACTEFPSVVITAPAALHLQTSTSLEVQTLTCFNEAHTGW